MHDYHTLHQWGTWLNQSFLGQRLLDAEKKLLSQLLANHFGNHAILIGVPQQYPLLETNTIHSCAVLSPLTPFIKHHVHVETNFYELPILTGSTDLVILPHAIEYTDNPRQLLAEACRIIKPQGIITICGFNPYGVWNLCKPLFKNKPMPKGRYTPAFQIRNWLQLLDFEIETQCSALYCPPISDLELYEKLSFIDKIGQKLSLSLGSAYIIIARAKVIPLTPIKMKWKQHLSTHRIPTIISPY